MLKDLKAKPKSKLECNIAFVFPLRILLSSIGSKKTVVFFSLGYNSVYEKRVKHMARGDEMNFPQNKYLIEQKFFQIPSNVSLGYPEVINCFLLFEEFLQ